MAQKKNSRCRCATLVHDYNLNVKHGSKHCTVILKHYTCTS